MERPGFFFSTTMVQQKLRGKNEYDAGPIDPRRTRLIRDGKKRCGPVLYWMSRDQRSSDNWALEFALQKAREKKVPAAVVFCISPGYPHLTKRSFDFLLGGVRVLAENLSKRDIPFFFYSGDPIERISECVAEMEPSCLVCDFDPLRHTKHWIKGVARKTPVPVYQVDAHNVVPCWLASDHKEYAARTFRPRLLRKLGEFLTGFPSATEKPVRWPGRFPKLDLKRLDEFRKNIPPLDPVPIQPGEEEAMNVLEKFLKERLTCYTGERNNPLSGMSSGLSPYLHFGQLSAQRVLLELLRINMDQEAGEAFREQVLVRRELADNYCWYEPLYDTQEGFPAWARKTLSMHLHDRRPYLYRKKDLESGMTHDPLWNVAQREMVSAGTMHGYLRMYWAKKILEWTVSPGEALRYALEFNDRYQIDGRDPNGYTGVAWCIGGVHDRPWKDRPVFGHIRYMSYEGCRRKFDVEAYIDRWSGKEENL